MSRVFILQCLCPARHCIAAIAYEGDQHETTCATLKEFLAEMIAGGQLHPWCGLCGSPASSWFYEKGETAFESLQEAAPTLIACSEAQEEARKRLRQSGLAYDVRRN